MYVYLVRPIAGCVFDEVVTYYEETADILSDVGYEVLYAMMGKCQFRGQEGLFKNKGYTHPVSTDRAIIGRDRWMTKKADIIFANLMNAKTVSIGSVMELAWAFDHGKHVVLAMEENNIHRHAFITQCADIVFSNYEESIDYLTSLRKY
jgi:nucleoside 2-deoxyribosyltransferase